MGTQISIDKHVSNLDDILEMQSSYFEKIKFESKVSPDITQHLKVHSPLQSFQIRYGGSLKTNANLIMCVPNLCL
jgi:hypothetical protein